MAKYRREIEFLRKLSQGRAFLKTRSGWRCIAVVVICCGCSYSNLYRWQGIHLQDEGVYLNCIAPVMQDAHLSCGPACVAAVAGYWQVDLTKLIEQKSRTKLVGRDMTGDDLAQLSNSLGLRAYFYAGSWEDLLENLSKGRPLIVMFPLPEYSDGYNVYVNLLDVRQLIERFRKTPAHWVVLTGRTRYGVIIHDPSAGAVHIPTDRFMSWWKQCNYGCLLLSPK